jgi:hypothetical protein
MEPTRPNPLPRPRTRHARQAAAAAAALALTLGLAACGDDDDDVVAGDGTSASTSGDTTGETTPGDGTTTPTDGTTPGTVPASTDGYVLRVIVGGGFVPVEQSVATIASATLLDDGTLITPAAVTLQYPGAAIQPLQSTMLTAEQVDALMARADELGLLDGPLDFGEPAVADAPSTTVTFVVDGQPVVQTANALGMEGMADTVDAEAQANRDALQAFLDELAAVSTGDEAYPASAVAVISLGTPVTDPSLPQEPVDWPLAVVPEEPADVPGGWPCVLVTGADLDTLLPVLETANQVTPWVVDGVETALAFRPVLPGDGGCQL